MVVDLVHVEVIVLSILYVSDKYSSVHPPTYFFPFVTVIYSSQSTLNHLLFILFSSSIISFYWLSQGTGEKW